MNKLTVLDIFCGAGGFSEGFRQQGFKIVQGVDSWQPAIDTFNHNFKLSCSKKNIKVFRKSIKEIEALPDTEIIIGSPPCVSFSHSNLSGKADKKSGVLLTEIFLRMVAVKKFKKGSKLKAWFMENVTNSTNYLNDYYTFKDLNLTRWAKSNGLSPNKKAIILDGNQLEVNSANHGAAQKRTRVISGELIERLSSKVLDGKLPVPPATHKAPSSEGNLPNYVSVGSIKKLLPSPNSKKSKRILSDPQYPSVKIAASALSDHFYDTGLYTCEWKLSKHLKTNHWYMGTMSFPENEENPSRTITATKIGSSREAIIYRSEFDRRGDGEYRTPTVREAACIMGFPITYQFKGSENTKWRLVGNAVSPSVSRAFAKELRSALGMPAIDQLTLEAAPNLDECENLNRFAEKVFDDPPKKNSNSRFRLHPFKSGNITVSLSNYDIKKNTKDIDKWFTSVQYGTGEGFPSLDFPGETYKVIEPIIESVEKGPEFLEIMHNGFSERLQNAEHLQELYVEHGFDDEKPGPVQLVRDIAAIIGKLDIGDATFPQETVCVFEGKKSVPLKQLFALYAMSKISDAANK